jgi:hypothetical protein
VGGRLLSVVVQSRDGELQASQPILRVEHSNAPEAFRSSLIRSDHGTMTSLSRQSDGPWAASLQV